MSPVPHRFPAGRDPVEERIREWMRSTPLRLTQTRLDVVRALQRAARPVNAEGVFRAAQANGADVGIATIYRILRQLEQEGLVRREVLPHAPAKACYVIRVHEEQAQCSFACAACGRRSRIDDPALIAMVEELARRHGFVACGEQLLRGRCQDCGRDGAVAPKPGALPP